MTASGQRVGDQIVESLEQHGVDKVYCVPGESFLGVTDALNDARGVALVICRHEGGAGFMAVADGRMAGRPGVCMVSRGPGVSNAMIALHTALHDAVPLVVLVGQVRSDEKGRQALQEHDYSRFLSDVAKAVLAVDVPAQAGEVIGRAFHLARSGTPGPVAVILPEDVLDMQAEAPLAAPIPQAGSGPAEADLARLAERLRTAQRPLVLVGGAFRPELAGAALYRLAEGWGLPVCTTNRRLHLYDCEHAHFAGHVGIRTPAPLLEQFRRCDLLISLGERMTDAVSQGYSFPQAPQPQMDFVHVWPDPEEVGRVWRPWLGMPCEPHEVVLALSRLAAPQVTPARAEWISRLHRLQAELAAPVWEPVPDGVNFAAIVCGVQKRLARDAVVTSDAGNFASFLNRYLRVRDSQLFLSSVVGAMGSGVPMAVAASIREPRRQVVGFVGDGGLMMTGNELATARLYGARPIVIVSDNASYGTIAMHQRGRYPGRPFEGSTRLHAVDIVRWAQAFGAHAVLIETEAEVDAALDEAFRPRDLPVVVHVRSSSVQATAWRRFEA